MVSPYINHFIQPDTIIPNPANPQSLNRYSYVMNNPIRYSDPTGHVFEEDTGGVGGPCNTTNCLVIINNLSKPKKKHQPTSVVALPSTSTPTATIGLDPSLLLTVPPTSTPTNPYQMGPFIPSLTPTPTNTPIPPLDAFDNWLTDEVNGYDPFAPGLSDVLSNCGLPACAVVAMADQAYSMVIGFVRILSDLMPAYGHPSSPTSLFTPTVSPTVTGTPTLYPSSTPTPFMQTPTTSPTIRVPTPWPTP